MRFNFIVVPDGMGEPNPRPVFPMRLASDLSRRRSPLCLLDTGSLDTFMARDIADEAGIDLTDVEDHDPFPLVGAEVKGLPKIVNCVIEDGTGSAVILKDIRVISTSPSTHSFGAILGTIAIRQIHIAVSAAQEWIEISEATTDRGAEECSTASSPNPSWADDRAGSCSSGAGSRSMR